MPFRFVFVITLCTMMTVLVGCHSLPKTPHLPKSQALSEQAKQRQQALRHNYPVHRLAFAISNQAKNHPNLSGYYPIVTGAAAFAARSSLANLASQTIDIQYYIWHDDEAGRLMLKALWDAADRGVIVRLLLDDINSSPQLDAKLRQFASHPNIAVRLINPKAYRNLHGLDYALNPLRINRRMHNKSMTFDNKVSIIGGRNIGNEYLDSTSASTFADLDVMLVGAVVGEIGQSFEQYWSSPLSFDIESLVLPSVIEPAPLSDLATGDQATPAVSIISKNKQKDKHKEKIKQPDNPQIFRTYQQAMKNTTIGHDILNYQVPFYWTNIHLMVDDVQKLSGNASPDGFLIAQLQRQLSQPAHQFSIISSYFVPTKDGVKILTQLARQGVQVRILTNSFDATDVGIVHAGYAHWRKDLLQAGVQLFEIKASSPNEPNASRFIGIRQQSRTSLHAKAFAIDEQIFIGSYNIDPRSANINSEIGVLIQDGRLANQLHDALSDKQALLQRVYELKLNAQDKIEWHTIEQGQPVIYQHEPHMSKKDRAVIGIVSWLPIDWLL
ncbi:phospholipase D family protein [Moraxella sp. ZJ142]|uniref:phospholipase D family protein n=1 Tax=Moraxella marmotae TaxID=3344520 RepID=UPI0035D41021